MFAYLVVVITGAVFCLAAYPVATMSSMAAGVLVAAGFLTAVALSTVVCAERRPTADGLFGALIGSICAALGVMVVLALYTGFFS